MKKRFFSLLASMLAAFTFASCTNTSVSSSSSSESGDSSSSSSSSQGGTSQDGVFVFGQGKKIEGDATQAPSAVPTYTSDGKLQVTSWGAPVPTAQQIEYFLEAGFNTAILDGPSGYAIGSDALWEALEVYSEYDIDAYIQLGNGWQQRGNGLQLGGAENPTYFWKSLKKFFEAGVDYTEHDNFVGIMVFDEPGGKYGTSGNYNDFDHLETEWELFKGLWEGCEIDGVWYDPVFKNGSYKDYEFHVNTCGDKQYVLKPMMERIYPMVLADGGKMSVYIDHYPLKYNATDDIPAITETYLYYYDICGDIALNTNLPFGAFVLTGQMNSVLGYARGDDMDGYWSEAELRWQYYSMVAFGGINLAYFTYYRTPTESGTGEYIGIIDSVGKNKTKAYEYTAKANAEFHKLFPVLDNFNYLGTMMNVGTRNKQGYNTLFDAVSINSVSSHYRIADFTSSRDTLIAAYKDGSGYDAFLFVNHEDPYYKRADEIQVTFNNATKAVVYDKGEPTIVNLVDGKFSYTIEHGNGIFVIPLA